MTLGSLILEMPQEYKSPEPISSHKSSMAKRARDLAAELSRLTRQQFETMETATFLGLTKDQNAECNRRGQRIRRLFQMLARRGNAA